VKAFYAPHPHFQLPSNTEAKIWRYSDLAKLITVLEQKALYFPCTLKLPDPFEGLFSLPTASHISALPNGANIIQSYKHMKRSVFVNSWHLNEHESHTMWNVYARAEAGVAIQSTVSRLISSFPALPDPSADMALIPQVFIGAVKYLDYESEAMDWGNLFLSFLLKNKQFEAERELRAVVWRPLLQMNDSDCGGFYVEANLETLIESVYISPNAPPYYVEAVTAICKRYQIHSPVTPSRVGKTPHYYAEYS
jgi:hypothetical protein